MESSSLKHLNIGFDPKCLKQQEMTGTTIMAIIYDGGVLIGADSFTTSGNYVFDRAADKLDFVHDRICCLRSGTSSDTQTLNRYTRYYMSMHSTELGRLPHVKSAAKTFQNFIYEYKDQLSASIIIAGWDPYDGPAIYQVTLGGTMIQSQYATGGSGSGYIQASVEDNYKKNMTLEEAKKFLLNTISHAMKADGSSGGIIRLISITKDGLNREFYDYKDLPNK